MSSGYRPGPCAAIEIVRCDRTSRDASPEETSAAFTLVLPRRGAFRYHGRSGTALADPNVVLLFHPDEPHRITHPADGGDECVALRCVAGFAIDALGHASQTAGAWIPTAPAQRRLHAEADAMLACADDLERDERAAQVLALVGGMPRSSSHARDRTRIDAVRERIAADPGERATLATLASDAGVSPFHLARRFRAHTGTSVHQYRLSLRLASARTALRWGETDVTRLAFDLGFASASHFGQAYRRAYGHPPTATPR